MNKEGTKREGTVVTRYGLEMDTDRLPSIVKEEVYPSEIDTFTNPAAVDAFCRSALRLDRQCEEHLCMLCLDAKGRVLAFFELSHGTSTKTFCGMKETAVRMLLSGAVSCILVHNHPSGNTSPSMEDERMSERISEVANMLDVRLLDFIVIGRTYFSFSEHGKIES